MFILALTRILVNRQGPIGFGVTAKLPDIEEDDIVLQAEPGNVISISAERIIKRTVRLTARSALNKPLHTSRAACFSCHKNPGVISAFD